MGDVVVSESGELHPQAGRQPGGRVFTGLRKVRLGDVTTSGRLRLDALTRYTQDVSDDDTTDAGLDTEPAWVVRRTLVDVLKPAQLAETIEISTFCSGLGRRWAERRLCVSGSEGARYEAATLWICIDPTSGRPRELTDQFHAIYGPSAQGRSVKARLTIPKPADSGEIQASAGTVSRWTWPLRAVDLDTLGHVNNAAYWAVIEEVLYAEDRSAPYRALLEYSGGVEYGDDVSILSVIDGEAATHHWFVDGRDAPAAAASIVELPADLYRVGPSPVDSDPSLR